jgi:hypothetical protein
MGRSMQTFEKIYRGLEEHTKTIGLTIKTMKPKVMIQSRRDVSCQQTDILDIEAVDSFTYLGTELTKGYEEEVEIKKRIMSANKVYFSLLPIIKSRLAQRKDKLRLYKTLIRPVLGYGCEAWTMTQISEERLAIFERKILRRILGSLYEDNLGWRLRHNKEFYELLDGPDIVIFIKFKRLQWAGHIVRMDNSRIPKKYWMENSMEEDHN